MRAFHNVCRHRGSRILDVREGCVGNLVCPYHHWTYGVDGGLLHAENQPAGFDRSRFRLKPVHVRTVAGLVFLCLADEPPTDFDDVAARLEPYLAPYDLRCTKVAHQDDIVEQGNWKLVMENNRECYHCDGHPELLTAYFPSTATPPRTSHPACAGSGSASSGPPRTWTWRAAARASRWRASGSSTTGSPGS